MENASKMDPDTRTDHDSEVRIESTGIRMRIEQAVGQLEQVNNSMSWIDLNLIRANQNIRSLEEKGCLEISPGHTLSKVDAIVFIQSEDIEKARGTIKETETDINNLRKSPVGNKEADLVIAGILARHEKNIEKMKAQAKNLEDRLEKLTSAK